MTITNQNGGETDFFNNSTAANATIVNGIAGFTTFNNMASAGTRHNDSRRDRFRHEQRRNSTSSTGGLTIFNYSTAAQRRRSSTARWRLATFNDHSTAGNANITNRFGGQLFFTGHSTAGNATIINGSFGVSSVQFQWVCSCRPEHRRQRDHHQQ